LVHHLKECGHRSVGKTGAFRRRERGWCGRCSARLRMSSSSSPAGLPLAVCTLGSSVQRRWKPAACRIRSATFVPGSIRPDS